MRGQDVAHKSRRPGRRRAAPDAGPAGDKYRGATRPQLRGRRRALYSAWRSHVRGISVRCAGRRALVKSAPYERGGDVRIWCTRRILAAAATEVPATYGADRRIERGLTYAFASTAAKTRARERQGFGRIAAPCQAAWNKAAPGAHGGARCPALPPARAARNEWVCATTAPAGGGRPGRPGRRRAQARTPFRARGAEALSSSKKEGA